MSSTSCQISIQQPDGTVRTMFCQKDGYLDYMGVVLIDYYSDYQSAEKLVNAVALSSVDMVVHDTRRLDDSDLIEKYTNYTVNCIDDLKPIDPYVRYEYVFAHGNWYWREAGSPGWYKLNKPIYFRHEDAEEYVKADIDYGHELLDVELNPLFVRHHRCLALHYLHCLSAIKPFLVIPNGFNDDKHPEWSPELNVVYLKTTRDEDVPSTRTLPASSVTMGVLPESDLPPLSVRRDDNNVIHFEVRDDELFRVTLEDKDSCYKLNCDNIHPLKPILACFINHITEPLR